MKHWGKSKLGKALIPTRHRRSHRWNNARILLRISVISYACKWSKDREGEISGKGQSLKYREPPETLILSFDGILVQVGKKKCVERILSIFKYFSYIKNFPRFACLESRKLERRRLSKSSIRFLTIVMILIRRRRNQLEEIYGQLFI